MMLPAEDDTDILSGEYNGVCVCVCVCVCVNHFFSVVDSEHLTIAQRDTFISSY